MSLIPPSPASVAEQLHDMYCLQRITGRLHGSTQECPDYDRFLKALTQTAQAQTARHRKTLKNIRECGHWGGDACQSCLKVIADALGGRTDAQEGTDA